MKAELKDKIKSKSRIKQIDSHQIKLGELSNSGNSRSKGKLMDNDIVTLDQIQMLEKSSININKSTIDGLNRAFSPMGGTDLDKVNFQNNQSLINRSVTPQNKKKKKKNQNVRFGSAQGKG